MTFFVCCLKTAGQFALFVSPDVSMTSVTYDAQMYYRYFIKAKKNLYYEIQFCQWEQKKMNLSKVAMP